MVMIEWQLDLQLPVQSVPISTKVVSSNPTDGEVYSIQHYVIKFVSTPKTNKTDRYDVSEILLKVVLNTMIIILTLYRDDVKSKFRKRYIRSDQRRIYIAVFSFFRDQPSQFIFLIINVGIQTCVCDNMIIC